MQTVTAEQLAALFGVSAEVVRSLARRGIAIKRPGPNCFALAESVRAYCQHLRKAAAGRGNGTERTEQSTQRARLARAPEIGSRQKLFGGCHGTSRDRG
jgi:phage terminase Nu1 subunit (DNA packaging protein)